MYNKQIISELIDLETSNIRNEIGVDIFMDDHCLFEYYKHEPRLYFRNGYNNEHDFLWIPIQEHIDFRDLRESTNKLSPYTLLKLREFVINNCHQLLEMANGEISYKEFHDYYYKKPLCEHIGHKLNEMAILSSDITGLYDSIWIDNGNDLAKSGHSGSDRIKYRTADANPSQSDTWYPVRISDGAFLYKPKKDWPPKELKKLEKYIDVNKARLILARKENWTKSELENRLAYIGKYSGEPKEPESTQEYRIYKEMDYGFNEIQNLENNKFNLEKNNKIISPIWFDFITPFNEFNGEYCLGCSQGIYYNIYPNGIVKMSEISKLHGFKSQI